MSVGTTTPDRSDAETADPGFISRVSPVQVRPLLLSSDSVSICHTPAQEYHSWEGVSASQLKSLALSPTEFYARHVVGEAPHYSSAAMEFGTLLHLWAELGEGTFWEQAKKYPDEVLTATGQLGKDAKAWAADQPEGSVLVTPSDWRKLYDQTRQILLNSAAAQLLAAAVDKEFNVRFLWNGHKCRCRCDGATDAVWYDLKTTKERNPLKSAWRAVEDFNYDIQAAFYGEAAVQCGWPRLPLHFIFTSTVPPYLCAVVTLPPEVMHRGRNRCLRLLEELAQRREWNQWLPADYGQVHELQCPVWMKGGE